MEDLGPMDHLSLDIFKYDGKNYQKEKNIIRGMGHSEKVILEVRHSLHSPDEQWS